MAIWDEKYSLGNDSYNPTQSNVLGQNLAPINPKGELSAVDSSNDTRDSYQYKLDAQQANSVATNTPDEDDNYIASVNGNKYQKVDNSVWNQSLAAAANYMSTYFATNGNVGLAGKAAGQALYDMDAKAHRLSQVDKLEDQGMNPLDIQNWINSGDKKDLITNKGSWTSGGGGTMFNTLTGEVRKIAGAGNPDSVPSQTVDMGDRKILYYPDGRQETVMKGATPRFQVSGATGKGGSIGLDDDENQPGAFIEDSDGGLLKLSGYNKDGTPRYTTANSKDIESYNSRKTSGTPNANQQLVLNDLKLVQGATDEQLDRFTGQIIGRSSYARDISSSVDTDTRQIYTATQRLATQLGNAAISAAQQSGASGINTEAEIKRFTAGVPQPDYSSRENLKKSINDIQDYAQDYQNQLMSKYGKPEQQAQPQPVKSQAPTRVERGADGKLIIVGG